jgi:hypothetical protein
MEKIVFEKSDIRDFVKTPLQKKLRNLKISSNLLWRLAVTLKKHQSMTACGKKCRKKYTRCRDSLVL